MHFEDPFNSLTEDYAERERLAYLKMKDAHNKAENIIRLMDEASKRRQDIVFSRSFVTQLKLFFGAYSKEMKELENEIKRLDAEAGIEISNSKALREEWVKVYEKYFELKTLSKNFIPPSIN